MSHETHYYEYEGIPCQVERISTYGAIHAQGYFRGKGLYPIDAVAVLFHGIPISEKEYREHVVALRRKN